MSQVPHFALIGHGLAMNTWKMLLKVGSELVFHPLELFHKTSFKLNFFMNTM